LLLLALSLSESPPAKTTLMGEVAAEAQFRDALPFPA